MMHLVKPGTKIDFIKPAPVFVTGSIIAVILSLLIITIKGVNLGLDFQGGHQILVEFEKPIEVNDVRSRLESLFVGVDTAVQSYSVPDSNHTFYLARVERSQSLGKDDLDKIRKGFSNKFGKDFKDLKYNPEAGDVVELAFDSTQEDRDGDLAAGTPAADVLGTETSSKTFIELFSQTGHEVRTIRKIGRSDEYLYSVVLKGADVALINLLKDLDPNVRAARVEFVGPTVGKQLRNDGILAVVYAMVCILLYVAFRFDLFYAPGAVLCLVHDAVVTTAILALVGEEFSLATIAGLLTLVGYSVNDTIIVFDRIRETASRSPGTPLKEVINRSINETLSRTLMTSLTTLIACISLMIFGWGTVLGTFGLLMTIGLFVGAYSSIYVASPILMYLREKYGTEKSPNARMTPSTN